MNVVVYALLTYAAMAVISLGVVAAIVLINSVLSSSEEEPDHD